MWLICPVLVHFLLNAFAYGQAPVEVRDKNATWVFRFHRAGNQVAHWVIAQGPMLCDDFQKGGDAEADEEKYEEDEEADEEDAEFVMSWICCCCWFAARPVSFCLGRLLLCCFPDAGPCGCSITEERQDPRRSEDYQTKLLPKGGDHGYAYVRGEAGAVTGTVNCLRCCWTVFCCWVLPLLRCCKVLWCRILPCESEAAATDDQVDILLHDPHYWSLGKQRERTWKFWMCKCWPFWECNDSSSFWDTEFFCERKAKEGKEADGFWGFIKNQPRPSIFRTIFILVVLVAAMVLLVVGGSLAASHRADGKRTDWAFAVAPVVVFVVVVIFIWTTCKHGVYERAS